VIDYTINVGHIIQIGVILGGGFVALIVMRQSVSNLKDDMTDMKAELKQVAKVLVTMAVTTVRLDNVEKDIRDMKHGRGFIRDRQDGGIQGEY
jgi:hypothetical protein